MKHPVYLLALSFILPAPRLRGADTSPITLSGVGTAIIDGHLRPSEWCSAGYFDFIVNTPYGGTAPGRLFAMNDENNAYFGLLFARSAADAGNTFGIEFDNDGSGTLTAGDDGILVSPSGGFSDVFRSHGFGCPPQCCAASQTPTPVEPEMAPGPSPTTGPTRSMNSAIR